MGDDVRITVNVPVQRALVVEERSAMMNDFMIAPPSNEDSVVDWKYDMRREMQLISPNLYLGPYACARDRALLASTGITHLLAVADANEAKFMKVHDGLVYQHIKVTDSLSENLIPYFPIAKHFLDAVLSNPANKVLVYCNNGMSRSPCFVVAYLMEALKWDFTTAFGYVQNRRFCISPNDNFKMQLREYQPIYQARLQNLAQHHPTPIPYPVAPFDPNNSVPGAVHRLGAKRRQLEEDDEFADHYGDHQNAGRVGGSGSGSGGMDMSD